VGFCYKVLHSPTNLFFPVELVGYSVGVAAFSYGLSCQRNSKKAVAQRNESVNAPEWKESAASKPSLTFWKKKTDDAATRHDEAVNKPSLSINIGAALPASSQVLPANPIGSGVNPLVSQVNLRQVQAIPRVEEEKPVKSIISFEKLQAYSKRFRLFGAHHTSRAKAVLGALQNADSDKTRLKLIQNQINLLAGNAGSLQLGIDTRWTMKAVSNKPKDISTSDYYQLLIALEKEITTAHLRVNRR
jgi:hypothetical protein